MITTTAFSACPAVASPVVARTTVRVEALSKRFHVRRSLRAVLARQPRREVLALDRVTFDARGGEILALLGPNGAGKSTLLKILSTLVLPDSGKVSIDGEDLFRDPAAVRRVLAPVAADERSLDWRLSAAENLRFFGALHGLRARELATRSDELLALVGLDSADDRLVASFSSGMRQRLLIARALLSRPSILLLDEPTRSLDPLAARSFREFIRNDLARRDGCTVILATHDPEEALMLSDRIAILDRGSLLAVGAPHAVSIQFGEERYRVWLRQPVNPGIEEVRSRASIEPRPEHNTEGWVALDLVLNSDASAEDVLASLVRSGVAVSRFERVQLTIAELLERVTQGAPRSAARG